MQKTDSLILEFRAARPLYFSYALFSSVGIFGLLWLRHSESPWKWLTLLTGMWIPWALCSIGLLLWGLAGIFSLSRHRLRFFENGLYLGSKKGKGIFLPWAEVKALKLDILKFPEPFAPLVGHYRIESMYDEIVLYPKMYANIQEIADLIAQRTGLAWSEIELSRQGAEAP